LWRRRTLDRTADSTSTQEILHRQARTRLSVLQHIGAVKTHIRSLFAKFAVEDLPQNRKRVRLAELAHRAGVW
jgi:hypothetical protein